MFENLQKGDQVIIRMGSAAAEYPYVFSTVIESGIKKIKTNHGDFSARSGNRWGDHSFYCDSLSTISIEQARAANVSHELEHNRRVLANEISDTSWKRISIMKLKAIKQILDTPEPKEEEE